MLNEKSTEDVFRQTEDGRPPTCLAFSTDGKLLLAGQDNGMARVWRVAVRAKPLSKQLVAFIESCGSIPIGLDRLVAVAGLDEVRFAVAMGGQVWLCDAEAGAKIDPAPLHDGKEPVAAMAVSHNANRLACAAGNSVFVYDFKSGKALNQFDHSAKVTALAFDEMGERLACGGQDGKIFVDRLEK